MSTTGTLLGPQPSSTFSPTSTQGSSSSAQPSQSNDPGGISHGGSELYLFTFLTTLLLLLGVSCAIIIRSLVLRRRFRRRVQEAIANGGFVPGLFDPRAPGYHVNPADKPQLHDVWIARPDASLRDTEKALENTLPVSATKVASNAPSPRSSRGSQTTSHPNAQRQRNPLARFFGRRGSPHADTPRNTTALTPIENGSQAALQAGIQHQLSRGTMRSNPQASDLHAQHSVTSSKSISSSTPTDRPQLAAAGVQISLLIAMPTASRPIYYTYHPPSVPLPSSQIQERRASTSSSAASSKGKAPAAGEETGTIVTGKSAWPDLEHGEVPYLELGVLDVGYRELPPATEVHGNLREEEK